MHRDVLLGMYHGQNMTMKEIGEKFGVSAGSISYHMDKHNIPENPLDLVSDSYLHDLHWEEGLTMKEIGKMFQISKTATHRYFKRNNIPKRTPREAAYNSDVHPQIRTHRRGYTVASSRIPDGSTKRFYVHRLTCFAHFNGSFEDFKDKQVHHRNKYKWDNRPRNLEALSAQQHQAVHHMNEWSVDKNGEPVLLSPKYAEEN